METKKCSKCGEEKELGEFHVLRARSDGRRSECSSCSKEYRNRYETKERMFAWHLKNTHNMTPEQYWEMCEKQGGKCYICLQEETHRDRRSNAVRHLSIDHCHYTGVVRRLLCQSCNVMEGHYNKYTTEGKQNFLRRFPLYHQNCKKLVEVHDEIHSPRP